jgi:hypothetical protein
VSTLLLVAVFVGGLLLIGFALRVLWFLIKLAVLIVALVFLAHLIGLA